MRILRQNALPILPLRRKSERWVDLGMVFYNTSGRDEFILDNVRLVRADRQPCPVCGHPTGDCSGDRVEKPHRILLQGATPSLEKDQTFLVEEDIFEERQVSQFTTLKVLVARAGQQIPLSLARELGLF